MRSLRDAALRGVRVRLRSPTSNFVDMDVLVVGSATQRLRDIFDAYWNSREAYPVETIVAADMLLAATDGPLVHTGYARCRALLLRSGVDLYELSPTRMFRNEELLVPAMSLGRLHSKAAVIDEMIVYLGSVNLDPRSDSTNTELGLLAESPELARQVIGVIDLAQRGSSYRLRFANDGASLEWLATGDTGDVVLTQEPEATPLMHLQNVLFGPFVPEQLL